MSRLMLGCDVPSSSAAAVIEPRSMTSRNASTCLRFIVSSRALAAQDRPESTDCHIRNEWKPFLALFDRMICQGDTELESSEQD
jgi:hypothetical protein